MDNLELLYKELRYWNLRYLSAKEMDRGDSANEAQARWSATLRQIAQYPNKLERIPAKKET